MKLKATAFVLLVSAAGLGLYFYFAPKTCSAIDAAFERTGEIVVSRITSGDTTMRGQAVGSPEYLDGMLDALPNDGAGYRYGDTLPATVHITVKPQLGISIDSKLPDGTNAVSLSHKMDCMDGFWVVTKNLLSGEKITASYTLILDQLDDGTLRAQRLLNTLADEDVPPGKFHVMAHFKPVTQ